MSQIVLVTFFAIALFPAVFLVLVPMVPAMSYMFLVVLAFGFIDHFIHLTVGELVVLSGLFVVSLAVDYFAGVLGAKYAGASLKSMLAGIGGLILGTVLFPPCGGLVGLFITVFVMEIVRRRTYREAFVSALGSLGGVVLGALINCVIAIIFLTLFVWFALV